MSTPGQAAAKTVGQANQPPVDQLLTDIRLVIARARQQASTAVNAAQTYLYWQIGQRIHTELLGNERAPYGAQIVATVSRQLVLEYGRGYAEKNLRRMVQLAQARPALGRHGAGRAGRHVLDDRMWPLRSGQVMAQQPWLCVHGMQYERGQPLRQ